jgi:hypothetical protein
MAKLSKEDGVSLESVKTQNPPGYLEQNLRELAVNPASSKSIGELIAIGKAAIPFLEDEARKQLLLKKEVTNFYIVLGEIGGNEAASSILRIFNEHAKHLQGPDFIPELITVCSSMVLTNSTLGESIIKKILKSDRSEPDYAARKTFAVAVIKIARRAFEIDKLESIALDQSEPTTLRSSALQALIGRGISSQRVESLLLKLLKNSNDPIFKEVLSIAREFSCHEVLPYFVEVAFSEKASSKDRIDAVRTIGNLGAQRYAADLISVLSPNDKELSAQILKTVITIGTANDLNHVLQKCSGAAGLLEDFPFRSFASRLVESPRMATACRPALQIILNEVFKSEPTGDNPILKRGQLRPLLETMIRCELAAICEQLSTDPDTSNYTKVSDEYRKSLAKRAFEGSFDEEFYISPELEGLGILAPFASEEALQAVASYTLGYSETEVAVLCLYAMKDQSVDAELYRIAASPGTDKIVKTIISNVLFPERRTFFPRVEKVPDPAQPLSENTDKDELSEVAIPLLDGNDSLKDFFAAPIRDALNRSLTVMSRVQALKRIVVVTKEQERELVPLLSDPAHAIRIATAVALAKGVSRSSLSETEAAVIDRLLLEAFRGHLDDEYSRLFAPFSEPDIKEAILTWKSLTVTESLCTENRENEDDAAEIRALLNPLLNNPEDFTKFTAHLIRKIESLPPEDPYAKTLTKCWRLLVDTRAIGLEQPFRFSEAVQRAIVADMRPSASDTRPVIILCFAEADRNQAASHFNRQVEEIIKRGFRVLVMEPGSRSELENSSEKLKVILDTSSLPGATHVFQFGHGRTDQLRLGAGEDDSESTIVSGDPRGLPQFSRLLAPGGGVTLLSCSTGGQISNESNLLAYYREKIFPHAAAGRISAPSLSTYLSGITLVFSESGDGVQKVIFPVQTNEL